jgi:hypothetical protein
MSEAFTSRLVGECDLGWKRYLNDYVGFCSWELPALRPNQPWTELILPKAMSILQTVAVGPPISLGIGTKLSNPERPSRTGLYSRVD